MLISLMRNIRVLALGAGLSGLMASPLAAQTALPPKASIDDAVVNALRWRNIGPANMMGRIVDIEGIASPSKTFYVSTAGGGLWKTTNNGTTFKAVMDTARVSSGGDLAIAPSDTNVIYWGTGEANSRNSISPGGGIYKSADGGKSWTFLGLADTRSIGRIQVHPTDPNTVWVAALGHPWGPNKERGLYKTTDGGKNWRLVKFIDEKTGFVDVQLDPRNPNTVWASSYQRVRSPYSLTSGGPGSALWKSTDGGETFTEVKGGGFPAGQKGRMTLDINASNPSVMYMMIEAAANATGPIVGERSPKDNGLWKSTDGGETFTVVNPATGEAIVIPADSPGPVQFEGELVAVIGKTARDVAEADALDFIAGYSIFNDASIRDYQFKSPQWTVGKNFDGTGAFGPVFVTADELPRGCKGLKLETRLNGEIVQSAMIDDMVFDVATLISTISEAMTLESGDIILERDGPLCVCVPEMST